MTVITGKENVRMASVLALRSALKLETRGMTRSGRSARSIAAEMLGLDANGKRPNSRTVYAALNAHIVDALGTEFDRPL